MTYEEAKALAIMMVCHGCPISFYPICDGHKCKQALDLICEALEKANKYRWHDLRKDPKDLPHGKDVVLAFDGAEYGAAVFYNSGIYHGWATSDQDLEPSEITAWKYIEPFEEATE